MNQIEEKSDNQYTVNQSSLEGSGETQPEEDEQKKPLETLEALSIEPTNQVPTNQVDDEKKISLKRDTTKSSSRCTKILNIRRCAKAIEIRVLFMMLAGFHIYFVACIYSQKFYYLLFAFYSILILDAAWVVFKRDGYDFYWGSATFGSYAAVMSILAVLEMNYKYDKDDVKCETNVTLLKNIPDCGATVVNFTICTMAELIIVVFLSSLVIGRWLMTPSRRMSRDAVYAQVASFTTVSADVIEIAQYMQNEQVVESRMLLRACQIIFVISLTQFCFSPSAVKRRNLSLVGFRRLIDCVFATEAWSLLLALFSQELPCFVLRLILLTTVDENKDISLYFFVLKNGLMILLLVSRVFVLTRKLFKSERNIEPSKDEENPR